MSETTDRQADYPIFGKAFGIQPSNHQQRRDTSTFFLKKRLHPPTQTERILRNIPLSASYNPASSRGPPPPLPPPRTRPRPENVPPLTMFNQTAGEKRRPSKLAPFEAFTLPPSGPPDETPSPRHQQAPASPGRTPRTTASPRPPLPPLPTQSTPQSSADQPPSPRRQAPPLPQRVPAQGPAVPPSRTTAPRPPVLPPPRSGQQPSASSQPAACPAPPPAPVLPPRPAPPLPQRRQPKADEPVH